MIRKSSMATLVGGALLAGAVFAAPAPGTGTSPTGTGATGSGTTTTPATGTSPGAGTSTPATAPATTSPTAAQAAALTDAQIMQVVATVDQHEIDASTKAMKKKLGKEAKDFAKMMKQMHTENKNKGKQVAKKAGITPAASTLSDSLKAQGDADVKAMQAKTGAEFEKAYIEAMVKGHTDALNLLDQRLIPTAQNADVKTFLTEARATVASHLEQAKRLQEGAQAATTTTTP